MSKHEHSLSTKKPTRNNHVHSAQQNQQSLYARYGAAGLIKLAVNVARTKALFPQARLIRSPFDLRGRNHLRISSGFTTGRGCRVEAIATDSDICLRIGVDFQMNDYCHIAAANSVTIGNNVLIASKVFITDLNHGSCEGSDADSHPESVPAKRPLSTKPVLIEDNVWIGEGVTVLAGSVIGKGSIIGSHAVVNSTIPPYCIAVGIPARVVKVFDFDSGKWIRAPR